MKSVCDILLDSVLIPLSVRAQVIVSKLSPTLTSFNADNATLLKERSSSDESAEQNTNALPNPQDAFFSKSGFPSSYHSLGRK
jgi:hypothetical protein